MFAPSIFRLLAPGGLCRIASLARTSHVVVALRGTVTKVHPTPDRGLGALEDVGPDRRSQFTPIRLIGWEPVSGVHQLVPLRQQLEGSGGCQTNPKIVFRTLGNADHCAEHSKLIYRCEMSTHQCQIPTLHVLALPLPTFLRSPPPGSTHQLLEIGEDRIEIFQHQMDPELTRQRLIDPQQHLGTR